MDAPDESLIPDLLYHTTLTVVDYHEDASGSTRTVYVLATHSTLKAAKSFALTALRGLGYRPEDFTEFASQESHGAVDASWTHGDGVVVFARAPAGHEFLVGIDTTPNNESLPAAPSGTGNEDTVVLPTGTDHLHYLLQTVVDYNRDRSGSVSETHIEGCYLFRSTALDAARSCLAGRRDEFAQYDERDSPEMRDEWPFGDDVVVHAIANTGENYYIAIRTPPAAHARHAKGNRKH